MKISHSLIGNSSRFKEVLLTFTPESSSEQMLLRRLAQDQIDISDGIIESLAIPYLNRNFPGMAVLKGDFSSSQGEVRFLLQLSDGVD